MTSDSHDNRNAYAEKKGKKLCTVYDFYFSNHVSNTSLGGCSHIT